MPEESNSQLASVGGNKKMLWIVGGVVVVLLLIAVFGGFGRGSSLGSAYFPGSDGVDVDRNADGTVTYGNNEGSVTVGSGASMPSNWPSDVPSAYSGATIMYSGTTNPTTGAAGSAIVYQTSASLQSVVEYYTARLRSEGWNIETTASMGATQVISAKKDTRTFGAYIADAGNGMVSVTAGVEL